MDLKSLPQNACPLCHEPALDMAGPNWTCRHCGCVIEYDVDTRHGRIASYPARFAPLRPHVGEEWLTRREMFERVEEAREAARAATAGPRLPLGPIAIVALALIALCVMLSAIASALVLSPTIARTRRAISAAYQPTPTPPPPTATVAPTPLPAALDSPAPTQAAAAPTPASNELAPGGAPTGPAVTATLAPAPTETPPQVVPTPTVELPPTFTPAPPAVPAPPLASPIEAQPQPQPPAIVADTATPLAEALPSPTAVPTPTLTPLPPTAPPPAGTPTPPPPLGASAMPGAVVVVSALVYQGTEGILEADEYVEVRNIGTVQQFLENWSIKAFHGNQQVDSFVFDSGFIIAAGQVCKIYTKLPAGPDNCGIADGFGRDEPLWPNVPNGSFSARLYNPLNVEVARYTY